MRNEFDTRYPYQDPDDPPNPLVQRGFHQLATLLLAIFHLEREPNRATVPVHEEPP